MLDLCLFYTLCLCLSASVARHSSVHLLMKAGAQHNLDLVDTEGGEAEPDHDGSDGDDS